MQWFCGIFDDVCQVRSKGSTVRLDGAAVAEFVERMCDLSPGGLEVLMDRLGRLSKEKKNREELARSARALLDDITEELGLWRMRGDKVGQEETEERRSDRFIIAQIASEELQLEAHAGSVAVTGSLSKSEPLRELL